MRELGLTSGRRSFFSRLFSIATVTALMGTGCPRAQPDSAGATKPGGSAAGDGDRAHQLDPSLARAVGRAIRPCILAHQGSDGGPSAIYTAELGLVPNKAGVAQASFVAPRHPGFEACAVRAINAAHIPIAAAMTMPVAFDFRAPGPVGAGASSR